MPVRPSSGSPPNHVAIIMDGNGRWARQRGLPRIEGHRRGGEATRRIIRACRDLDIRFLTLFAFSAENWKRPREEIDGLMNLLERFLKSESPRLIKLGIRVRLIGDLSPLPASIRERLDAVVAATREFDRWNLVVALNYGSLNEVSRAARAYAEAVLAGAEDPAACSWETFRNYFFTADIPDPDLVIRTSGEYRLSNFLMLQSAYAELYFTPVLWPDFSGDHLAEAVEDYKRRERRYGSTGEPSGNGAARPSMMKAASEGVALALTPRP
ncbi:MAG: di-trans,poly-cis-decaprenylcistransferase [Puniceicoccaceae bacterium]|nr:MAG: di-trans,poly-cis-decaprenylcistransferase [Puniceicoccaceae bacterium]